MHLSDFQTPPLNAVLLLRPQQQDWNHQEQPLIASRNLEQREPRPSSASIWSLLHLSVPPQKLSLADLYPSINTPLVDQYLAANGIVLAKTNLGELQSGYSTNPNSPTCDYCTTALNPYDPTRSPQGEPQRQPGLPDVS